MEVLENLSTVEKTSLDHTDGGVPGYCYCCEVDVAGHDEEGI